MENLIEPDFSQSLRTVQTSETPKEMLSVMRDGSQTLVRINSSSLSLLQTCARKSFYLLHEKWHARSGSPPLVFGLAIHRAMDVFYRQPRGERSIPKNFAEHADVMAHGHEAPEAHFLYDAMKAFIDAAQPLKGLPDTDKRSIASGVWTLTHYFNRYINDEYEIYRDEQGPFVERFFEATLFESPTLKIVLFGTIDFVLKNLATGAILPGDHKTASQLGMEFLNRIKPNHQYTGYMFGANRVFGIKEENFLVNGIQVKPRPLTARGGPPTFLRQPTRRTEEDFAEFTDSVVVAVKQYLAWEESGVWPLGHVDACAMWGSCTFQEVCAAPKAIRQNILESKFQRE